MTASKTQGGLDVSHELVAAVRERMATVVVGQDAVVDDCSSPCSLAGICCCRHAL
jgi:hypothetical protein